MFNKKKLLIVGAGYVGSASAIHLGLLGHNVKVFDIDQKTKNEWSQQRLPYEDHDLTEGLKKLKKSRNVPTVAIDLKKLDQYDAILICVSTPAIPGKGYDNSHVMKAIENVAQELKNLQSKPVVIIRSTLAPNTMQLLVGKFKNLPNLIYFPEFLREGTALQDLRNPPLSVFGVGKKNVDVNAIIEMFGLNKEHVHVTAYSVAEMVKVTSNIYHALKVCFANEIGQCSASLGIDASEVMRLFVQDKILNISPAYFKPGFAYGGPCLEKELQGLLANAEVKKQKTPLLKSIGSSNDELLKKIYLNIKKNKNKIKTIGVIGLSFKAGSVDQRNSPVCRLVDMLQKDFEIVTFSEKHKDLKLIPAFDKFLDCSDLVLIGSHQMSSKEAIKITKLKKNILDLKINFKNAQLFANYKKYSSILEPILF